MKTGTSALAISAFVGSVLATGAATAQEALVGQPTPGGIGLQPAASPVMVEATQFHNSLLMPVITIISLLVLGLLIWVAIRYNSRANPVPARWSHNTLVEVIWTVLPVFILGAIAIFSFRLLFAYENMPEPDLTVKVTGNQWNWAYEYPDQGIAEYISSMLPEEDAEARGVPFRLAADEPMVVPVGRTVKLLVTGADVIHSVAMPAFGIKTDAIPGRTNETWFKADRVGTYYGQCSELCGVDHAFMPIEIRVVTEAEFTAWVGSKGGSMTPAGSQPAVPAATAPAGPGAAPAGATADAVGPAATQTDPAAAPVATAPAIPAAAPAAQ